MLENNETICPDRRQNTDIPCHIVTLIVTGGLLIHGMVVIALPSLLLTTLQGSFSKQGTTLESSTRQTAEPTRTGEDPALPFPQSLTFGAAVNTSCFSRRR